MLYKDGARLVIIHMLYKYGVSPVYYNGVLNPMYYEYSVNNTLCLENLVS